MFKLKGLLTFFLFFIFSISAAFPNKAWNVAPSHWYIGFSDPVLEIIINASEISAAKVSMKAYPGVEFLGKMPSANRHVAYLKVKISPKAKPGFLEFYSKVGTTWQRIRGDRSFKLKFELKKRDANQALTINTNDVIYEILVDRFSNGDRRNDKGKSGLGWSLDRTSPVARHGGDLAGVINKLDYLNELGVTTLNLNPIQSNANSNKAYLGIDLSNHFSIDKGIGSFSTYTELMLLMKTKQMKMMMDISPNYFGSSHWMSTYFDTGWFYDEGYKNNVNQSINFSGPYAPKFNDLSLPSYSNLIQCNQSNPHIRRYLKQVYLWWAEMGQLSAYRVQGYQNLNPILLNELENNLQSDFPSLKIYASINAGNNIHQAYFAKSNLRQFKHNTLHSLTDYNWNRALHKALGGAYGKHGLDSWFDNLNDDILFEDPNDLLIFADNLETPRLSETYKGDFNKWKSAITLLFTGRGMPSLLYGTEVLLSGNCAEGDMLGSWAEDSVNLFSKTSRSDLSNNAFNYTKLLIDLRKKHESLYNGGTINYKGEDNVFVYFRYKGSEKFMVVMNQSSENRALSLSRFSQMIGPKNSFLDVESKSLTTFDLPIVSTQENSSDILIQSDTTSVIEVVKKPFQLNIAPHASHIYKVL